jgi:hypothetical protein
MPKTFRLGAWAVGWISWEVVEPNIFRSPSHDDPCERFDQAIGDRGKTGLDWRVILGVLAACWIF